MKMSGFGLAWPKVAVGSLLLIAALAALTGRHTRAVRRACADARAIDSKLFSRLRDPLLKISLGMRIAVFLGIVLVMSAKPELWESIGIVGTSVVVGFFSSLLSWGRCGSLSAASSELGH